jgi:hypothetical protein
MSIEVVSVLRQMNALYTIVSYFFKIRFNIIFSIYTWISCFQLFRLVKVKLYALLKSVARPDQV